MDEGTYGCCSIPLALDKISQVPSAEDRVHQRLYREVKRGWLVCAQYDFQLAMQRTLEYTRLIGIPNKL
jgi:hypothetical protein